MSKGISCLQQIHRAIGARRKQLAVLIDPDKQPLEALNGLLEAAENASIDFIFVGGSGAPKQDFDACVAHIKSRCSITVFLFPGDASQLSAHADALLFLSLLSGRNPDFLIQHHVQSAPMVQKMQLECVPCAYLLIGSGQSSSVAKVSKTSAMAMNDVQGICDTALAGQLLGMQLCYLEAGSGAEQAIAPEVIQAVKRTLNIPLIVGGGIRNVEAIDAAYAAGADLVVVGNHFEKNPRHIPAFADRRNYFSAL